MKKVKSKPQAKVQDYTYAISQNGDCFELHKKVNGSDKIEKVFIQADTNYKDFKEASNKYRI